jgi:hypothetical protein
MTGINGIIYILSTIPTFVIYVLFDMVLAYNVVLRWYLVDRWGRRVILLSGAIFMCIALNLTGYYMYLNASYTPKAVVICVIVFNAFFGYRSVLSLSFGGRELT